MKKQVLIIIGIVVAGFIAAHAQEYKVSKSTGKLEIKEINNLTVEGYAGNEIVFSSLDLNKEVDKRATGLRAISGTGLEDNTGFGLSVIDKGTTIEVYQLKTMGGPKVKIMIPKGVAVSYTHSSTYGGTVSFKNVESEIEISTVYAKVQLENVTGPMTVNTVHGNIEVDLSPNIKSPISLVSAYGLVDVTVPVAIKANVKMSTSYGQMFVDPAIKIEMEKQGDWTKYGSNKVEGKVNGGGIELSLTSNHRNIYLRKK